MDYKINLEFVKLLNKSNNFDEFKDYLRKQIPNINIREENNLALIANNYKINNFEISELESECKNIIIDKNKLKLIVYSYNSIYYDDDANHFLLNKENIDNYFNKTIYESYEGTMIILYYYNNKWNISTRKCIDANKSIWNNTKSYYNLFCECLSSSFNEFTDKLNKEEYYFFTLVHHENKYLVDYSDKFGINYKKIIHIMTRNINTHEEINILQNKNLKELVEYPKKLENYDLLYNYNNEQEIKLPIKLEGLVVKLLNKDTNKCILLKFYTNAYKILAKLKPSYNNILKTFIELYKEELLKEHLIYFPKNNIILLKNGNHEKEFDTIGIIDGLFKVITSELFELFKLFYSLKDCSHKNEILYNKLPNDYKVILYKIRGLYFEKKDLMSKIKDKDINFNYKSYNLKITDIYRLLKNYDTRLLLKLINSRKDLFKIEEFNIISNKCDQTLLQFSIY